MCSVCGVMHVSVCASLSVMCVSYTRDMCAVVCASHVCVFRVCVFCVCVLCVFGVWVGACCVLCVFSVCDVSVPVEFFVCYLYMCVFYMFV